MESSNICAIASPAGNGAIAIIRVSGENAIEIAGKIFKPKNQKTKITEVPANTVHFGEIVYSSQTIDEVMLAVFKAPHSYTGENSVEIYCHGSEYIQQKIIEILIQNSCRLANPGEFTQRAFLNGKLDLSQAEGVADLIASETEAEHRLALSQLKGGFSKELALLRERMVHFVSFIELELDFAEEDVEFADRNELKILINSVIDLLSKLINSFKLGNAIKNGVPVSIAGKPNAGKSTLLNALLNEERALVSDIPGTTRDTIEEIINISGIKFRLIDTAGIRDTSDVVEKMGVDRAIKSIENSDIFVYLFDAGKFDEKEIKEDLKKMPEKPQKLLIANKTDLIDEKLKKEILKSFPDIVFISAKQNNGIEDLKEKLYGFVKSGSKNANDVIVTNARHYEALLKAKESVERAMEVLENDMPSDLMTLDIRQAIHYIGEITGEITNDEILGNIFKNFCIGK